jgi:hypothetical protein
MPLHGKSNLRDGRGRRKKHYSGQMCLRSEQNKRLVAKRIKERMMLPFDELKVN